MRPFNTLLTALLLLSSSSAHAVVESHAIEGYSFNASRLAKAKQTPAAQTQAIPYDTIRHHTRQRTYHSALSVTRTVSNVTIAFHTKQELTELRGKRVNGFSRVRNDGSCEIHVMMPYNWNDEDAMRTVGHELMLCFGAVHERGEHQHREQPPKATPALHRIAETTPSTQATAYQQVAAHSAYRNYKTPLLIQKPRD